MGRRQCRSSLDSLAKPLAQTLLALLVVGDLFKELFLRLFKEAYRFHRVRRRAAAKTSSAGMSLASPRSYLAIREAISLSQASWTSGSDSRATDSISYWASCARSSIARLLACLESSSSRDDMFSAPPGEVSRVYAGGGSRLSAVLVTHNVETCGARSATEPAPGWAACATSVIFLLPPALPSDWRSR